MTSWPQLISKVLVAQGRAASYWPCTFFTPRMFLLSIHISLLFVNLSLLCGNIVADAIFKLSLKCSSPHFHYRMIHIDCVYESLCKSFAGGPSYGNYQPGV